MQALVQTNCPQCGSPYITYTQGQATAICQSCGTQFTTGQTYTPAPTTGPASINTASLNPGNGIDYAKRKKINIILARIFFPMFAISDVLFFLSDLYWFGAVFALFSILFFMMAKTKLPKP